METLLDISECSIRLPLVLPPIRSPINISSDEASFSITDLSRIELSLDASAEIVSSPPSPIEREEAPVILEVDSYPLLCIVTLQSEEEQRPAEELMVITPPPREKSAFTLLRSWLF